MISNSFLSIKGMKLKLTSSLKKEMSLRARGSFTLEAAMVLPIFTCLVVAILFFFRVIEIQLSLEKALDYAARQGASITTELEQTRGVVAAEALGFKRESSDRSNSDYPMWPGVIIAPIADGENLTLSATYLMKLPLPLIGTKYLPVNQKVSARKWVGYTGGLGKGTNVNDTIVYVTSDSEVYHTTTSCTHLKLTVSSVTGSNLSSARSETGRKYTRCHLCKPPSGLETYYIAKEGDRYHMSTSCSGLKRSYYTKLLSEVEGILRPCSRCGN